LGNVEPGYALHGETSGTLFSTGELRRKAFST
jgi:hypothetical protein